MTRAFVKNVDKARMIFFHKERNNKGPWGHKRVLLDKHLCSVERKSGLAVRNAHRKGEDCWQIEREKAKFLLARSGGSEKSRGVLGLGP